MTRFYDIMVALASALILGMIAWDLYVLGLLIAAVL